MGEPPRDVAASGPGGRVGGSRRGRSRAAPDPETVDRLHRSAGDLATASLRRLDETLPWYRGMPPEDRSWVGLVAQAGISAFLAWYRDPTGPLEVTADVFGTAPRELTRSVSLSQTLELVRTVVDVVEEHVELVAPAGEEQALRESVLRYSREVAFAAAEVYAGAAEARGAWDARLEALVVDALLRGERDDSLQSRVAALGWHDQEHVAVLVGTSPPGQADDAVVELRRLARGAADDALVGLQGDHLLVVLGSSGDPRDAAAHLVQRFGEGPVVIGPVVPGLSEAGRSARAALAGMVAARAWPDAPRPVAADDLLPERILSGDVTARRALVDRVHVPLRDAGGALAETVSTYLAQGRSLEATARELFVHPNTVRYRLRRATEVTGWDATVPREAFVLQVGLAVGALSDAPSRRRATSTAAPAPGTGLTIP